MDLKSCPNCGAEVPTVASRCKHCFYDFQESRGRGFPLTGAMAMFAIMMVIAAGVFYYRFDAQRKERVVVDEETKSFVFTRTDAEGTKTERIPWSDVVKIEHITGGGRFRFEVIAITTHGDRLLIQQSSEDSLANDASHLAQMMGKTFEDVSSVPGMNK